MMTNIHPTAIVDSNAQLGENITIGPYCIVGPEVSIGDDTELTSHVILTGKTALGEGNKLFPFVSLGQVPQDLKFNGEATELIVGNNNSIREHVTMNIGTMQGGGSTRVGDNNLFMTLSHVGHDSHVGNDCVLANGATLAGHVEVGDSAIIGGLSAVHQFCRIGHHAIIGGVSPVVRDVIPYGSVSGNRAKLDGINIIGLKRSGFDKGTIRLLLKAYKEVFQQDEVPVIEKMSEVAQNNQDVKEIQEWLTFLEASERGICRASKYNKDETNVAA